MSVTARNMTDTHPLTPPIAVVHDSGVDALTQLTESGLDLASADEIASLEGVSEAVSFPPNPIAPGELASATITTASVGDHVSVISQLEGDGADTLIVGVAVVSDSGVSMAGGGFHDADGWRAGAMQVFVHAPDAEVPAAGSADVTISNLTAGQPITPPVAVVHDPNVAALSYTMPSELDGIDDLSEGGVTDDLLATLRSAPGVVSVRALDSGGPIPPGGSHTATVGGADGAALSVVGMFACTNDAYILASAPFSVVAEGEPAARASSIAAVIDSGSEANDETAATVPCLGHGPAALSEGVGENVRAPHAGIQGVGDLDPDTYGWTADATARLDIVAPSRSDAAAYTKAFVYEAIARAETDGLESAAAYYNTPESVDGQWYIFIIDVDDLRLAHIDQDAIGTPLTPVVGARNYPIGAQVAAAATPEGAWTTYTFPNPVGGTETKHSWLVLDDDGVMFGSGWYEVGPDREDAPAYTKSFVRQAIALSDAVGIEAAAAYYNTPESVDGQWYMFIADENDVIVAHVDQDRIGETLSDALGPAGYPAGAQVAAAATPEGAWTTYTFPNPAGGAETKHSWVIRRADGTLFGSGWYEAGPGREDVPEYTKSFVRQAIALSDAVGIEAAAAYYNTPESVDGQWYMFIADENDVIVAHVDQDRIGETFSDALGPAGYPAGAQVAAAATPEGAWTTYTFANPAGGAETKHSWVIRRADGTLFGSGWYEAGPSRDDAPAYTKTFVQQAIALSDALGIESAAAYYNTPESVDGQWYIFIADENDVILAHVDQDQIGKTASEIVGPNGYPAGEQVAAAATPEGAWTTYTFANPAGGTETKHSWVIRRADGTLFGSGWYEAGPDREDAPAYTKTFVQQAIALSDALGVEAAAAYYNTPESVDGQWYMFIADENDVIVAHVDPDQIGKTLSEILGPDGQPSGAQVSEAATLEGAWTTYTFPNVDGVVETKHSWVVRRADGTLFGSGWYEIAPMPMPTPPDTGDYAASGGWALGLAMLGLAALVAGVITVARARRR